MLVSSFFEGDGVKLNNWKNKINAFLQWYIIASLYPLFRFELQFRNVGLFGDRETRQPGKINLEQGRESTTNSNNIIMASKPGDERGPHWWEKSAITTVPSLLSEMQS